MATECEVELLLLVGDLFESEWVSEAEVAEVRQVLARYKKPVLITPGNHDPLVGGGPYSFGEWPENVHIFGPKVDSVTFDDLNITVHGYGYGGRWLRENPFHGYRVPDDGRLHVVMIHGSYEGGEGTLYLPIKREEVQALGADYVAFGHYHQPQVLLDHGGLLQAAYAGSLEPLGYDEVDEHGALLLEVRSGGARAEWLALAHRAYRTLEVAVDGCQTALSVAERVRQAVPEESKGRDLLHVTFTGAADPALALDLDDVQERLQDLGYHLRLVDSTVPDIDEQSYSPHSAAGRYVAKLRERLETETDATKRRVLEKALSLGLLAYERGKVENS